MTATKHIALVDGDVLYCPQLLAKDRADALLAELQREIPWRQHVVQLFGRQTPAPRLSSWHGDPAAHYSYSGLALDPLPWTPTLSQVRQLVEAATEQEYNSVLLNLYRGGGDGMGWHSDDEPELGSNPHIASFSLGSSRRFLLRHKRRKGLDVVEFALGHGDLLAMRGTTQQFWKHQVPKTRRAVGARINLTFRTIQTDQ